MKKFITEFLIIFIASMIMTFNGFNMFTWQYWGIMFCIVLYKLTAAWFD